MEKFYVTTAIDYVNDTIHLGHALQKVFADVLARYYRSKLGEDNVFFLTGTDEYGQKAEKAAKAKGLAVKEFVDKISKSDQKEQDSLSISYNRFVRTTDADHAAVVKEIWKRVDENSDIYLGEYTGLYCEGCEAYYSEDDLIDGRCPFHSTLKIKRISEKNYFFRWSKYRNFLIAHLKSNRDFIIPEERGNEMLKFAEQIKDVPVSRTNVKWGIPVPNHRDQVIYVWFDALTNYLTGVGFLQDHKIFNKFWPADVHILGKDNLRWHALLWPAMLKSAGIDLPKTIFVNGFLSVNGQKISKSMGNIIHPSDWVSKFGADAVRFYLLRHAPIAEDSDVSERKLITTYNADLANGIGNLAERIFTMILNDNIKMQQWIDKNFQIIINKAESDYHNQMENYNLFGALQTIFSFTKQLDHDINERKPWAEDVLSEADKELFLSHLFFGIEKTVEWLKPFMPEKMNQAETYMKKIKDGRVSQREKLNLFPRIK